MLHPAVALFVLALVCALFLRHSWSARALFLTALLGLILSLVVQSPARPVGDSREYVAMAQNLGHFSRPSVTEDDLAAVRVLFPSDNGAPSEQPQLRAPDGRQDFPHFWFYSLLAAPFVRMAQAFGANPVSGFAVLNIALLIGLATWLGARISVAFFVVAGPIMVGQSARRSVHGFDDRDRSARASRSAVVVDCRAGVAATESANRRRDVARDQVRLYKQGWSHRKVDRNGRGAVLAALHPLASIRG
jgi:hypothetical protein